MLKVESYTLLYGTELVERSPALYEIPHSLLPCSHEPPTGPYRDPQESSQYPPILPSCLSKIQLNIILTSMPRSPPFQSPVCFSLLRLTNSGTI